MTGQVRRTLALSFVGASIAMANVPFRPPDRAERRNAVGETKDLSPAMRAALDDAAYEAIPPPGPADWLAAHDEAPQTFDAFVSARPNRPDARRRTIYLQPLGSFSGNGPPIDRLRSFAEAWFSLPVKLLPPRDLSLFAARHREPRGFGPQYATGDLLRGLASRLPGDAYALLGITMADLYPGPTWNFVFGEASLTGRVGVYSFVRYVSAEAGRGSDARTALLRSCKVLAHETGHMFGISHCIYYRCVMNGSNHLEEFDARPLRACPVCLRKLQWSTGFDVEARDRRLLDFFRSAGFSDEARWLEGQLAGTGKS